MASPERRSAMRALLSAWAKRGKRAAGAVELHAEMIGGLVGVVFRAVANEVPAGGFDGGDEKFDLFVLGGFDGPPMLEGEAGEDEDQ